MTAKRVCMLVWNGFVYDARVTKEAETLISHGHEVTVVAISTPDRPIESETLESGVHVKRVRRDCQWCHRLTFLPRVLRRLAARPVKVAEQSPDDRVAPDTSGKVTWRRAIMIRVVEVIVNWRLLRSAVKAKPSIVHAHDVNVLVPAWLASRLTGAKLVYDAHEISTDREGYHGIVWLIRLVERFVGRSADGFITTTDERAKHLVSNYGYKHVLVLQNRPRYSSAPRTNILREACHINNDNPIILYQGGLQWGRGLRNLIGAAAGIEEANFVFLGSGIEEVHLKNLVEAEGVEERVYFHPMVNLDLLPNFTASADIGMQTLRNTCLNHYTTDSNKLFEYIMAGLPVIASDFPEIRKIITRHSVGLLVNPDDVCAIRGAIERLLSDSTFYEACRVNAVKAARVLSWETQETQLAHLYDDLGA